MYAKLPITAIIVGKNEAHFLDRCLSSVNFCDEIIYTDIQSKDNSKIVAAKYTDIILDSEPIPSGEYAHSWMVNMANNDWILFIDPDEYLDEELIVQIINIFPNIVASKNIGAVLVPWEFYFKKKQLNGTIWGNNKKVILANKHRFSFKPITHIGRDINPGYLYHELIKFNNNVLHHYWMISYKVFVLKHLRYLKREGIDRYNAGCRISLIQLLKSPVKEFKKSFITCKGYKDGLLGLFLSVFWAFYQSWANLSLYLITKKIDLNR